MAAVVIAGLVAAAVTAAIIAPLRGRQGADGLVVVTVTTEVSVEVPLLPHAVVSPPTATITARAVTADNGRPAFMSSRYPIRKRGTPRKSMRAGLEPLSPSSRVPGTGRG